ncbi:MAG: prepilin-type N-terminal cleavage/methylation domain-containing protein [bacterium]|nr:prepilin-type N-terminal cleavage/methylation domain-containing protein [bacterium]
MKTQPGRMGVTLTELLVVLVIISLLATLALPTYMNHAKTARISTAELECKELADGEDSVGLIHGFYVPLQLLDDLPDGQTGGVNTFDAIERESTSIEVIDVNSTLMNMVLDQLPLNAGGADRRVRNMIRNWQGPFVTTQRVYIPLGVNIATFGAWEQRDYPLDPWGNPYLFYSPRGRVGSGLDPTFTSIGDGSITTTDDPFDRFAIVSTGPDGQTNRQSTTEDDIVYYFGKVYIETVFTP